MIEIGFGIALGAFIIHWVTSGSLPDHLKFGKGAWLTPYDDTDDRETFTCSGLSLYVDRRTGCHYISGGMFGNIIPRLDKDGKQICEKENDV